ncbi:interleukin 15, like isoform X2 [Festucalex cinctus]
MLRGRPALATVLCLAWVLLGDGARIHCSWDLFKRVKRLMDDAASCADCKLYTPSISDYMTCPKDTLNCFSTEVQVLLIEWERTDEDILNVQRGLMFLKDQHNQLSRIDVTTEAHNRSETACGPCELHPEEGVKLFLEKLLQTVEAFNSACSVGNLPPAGR